MPEKAPELPRSRKPPCRNPAFQRNVTSALAELKLALSAEDEQFQWDRIQCASHAVMDAQEEMLTRDNDPPTPEDKLGGMTEAQEAHWWDQNLGRIMGEAHQRGTLKIGTLEQLVADLKKANL